jgi:Zn-dependent membrane protease YugP
VTASIDLRSARPARRTLSTASALLLTIGGIILVAVILAVALGAVLLTGAMVFGAGLIDLV